MGRTVDWSKTQPLRADQVHQFEMVAARLAALSDDELVKMRMEWGEHIERLCAERGELDSELAAQMALSDVLVTELNHRRDVVQRMEADLNGGHLVSAGSGNAPDKFAAICDPRPPGKFCWEGPDRDTIEEAIEDARRHFPDVDPEVDD